MWLLVPLQVLLAMIIKFLFPFKKKSSGDTHVSPNVVLVASKIKDASGNWLSSSQTFTETIDGAAPALMSATYKDINGDGTVDRIDAVYSETITSSVFELGDWTLPTNGSGLTVGSGVFSGSTVQITVGSAPANTTNLSNTTVRYTHNQGTSNSMTDGTNHSITSADIAVTDQAAPVIIAAQTKDINGNGKIDRIDLTFSEDLDDSGGSNMNINSFTLGSSYSVASVTTDTGDDEFLRVGVTEKSVVDSDVTPTIAMADNKIADADNNMAAQSAFTPSDGAAPIVTNVNSNTAAGRYEIGDVIDVLITFSETVDVTGTPQLTLETGGSDAVVDYTSGTTTSVLRFDYTVGSGHASNDLRYKATNSLALNSGTIKDRSSNANVATRTLVAPGATNSLGANEALVIDGSVPTFVKAWQYDTDGDGNIDEIVVELSEAVSDASVAHGDFALGSGSVTGFSSFSSGSRANTKDAADNDEFITLEVSVTGTADVTVGYTDNNSGNDLEDLAGNDAATNTSITTDDQAAPVIIAAQTKDINGNGKIDRIDLTFSEDLDDSGGSNMNINSFTLGSSYSVASVTTDTGDDEFLRVGVTEKSVVDSDVTPTIAMADNKIADADNNMAAQSAFTPSDGAAPIVTNVNSNTAAGRYEIGDVIDVLITFSETVDVTGTPQLTLETGGSDAVVDYTSGTTTSVLRFDYTVGSGHASNDLRYKATNSLALNSGTIKDRSSNANVATRTLVAPGATNSLGANEALVIDGSVPTFVKAWQYDTDGDGNIDEIVVELSEAVSDASVAHGDFALGSGSVTGFSSFSSGSRANTKDAADNDEFITLEVSVTGTADVTVGYTDNNSGNDLEDLAGNDAATNTSITTDDQAAPVIIAAQTKDINGNGKIDRIDLTFSEDLDDSGGSNMNINSFTLGSSYSVASVTTDTGDDEFLRVGVTEKSVVDSDVTPTIAMADNKIADADNNMAAQSAFTPSDGAAPIVTNVNSNTAAGRYEIGDVIDVLITFSETVDVTGTPQLTLETGGSDAVVDYTSGTTTSVLRFDYTVGSGHASNDLRYKATNSLALNSGTIKDRSSNANVATRTLVAPGATNSLGANEALVIDGSVPTFVKAWQYDTDGDGNIDEIVVELSEAVSDASVAHGDFALGSGSVTGFSSFSSGSRANTKDAADNDEFITLEVSVTGTADVTVGYTDNNSGNDLEDLAGNDAATNTSITTDDQAAPVIIAAQTKDINGNGKIDRIDLTFSEDLDDSGGSNMNINSFTLGSSYSVASVTTDTGDDEFLRVGVTEKSVVDSDVTPTIAMADNKIADADNNMAAQSAFTPSDGAAPIVTNVNSNTAAGRYEIGDVIDVLITFSETVDVTGTPQLTLETGGSDAVVDYTSGTTTSVLRFDYTVGSGHASNDLRYKATNSLALNSGTIKDRSSNANVATRTLVAPGATNSLGANEALVIDGSVPTFVKAWQYDTDGDGNIDEIVVELSEAVSDASVAHGDFALGSGSVTGFSSFSSGSRANTKDAADNDEFITLEVSVTGTADVTVGYTDNNSGNDLEDLAGNDAATNTSITTDDQAAPVIIAAQTKDINGNGKIDRIDLTFSEDLDDSGGE